MHRPLNERVESFLGMNPHEIGYALVRDMWEEIKRLQPYESECKKLHRILDDEHGESGL